ncbi:MAG: thioredoxin fold domain-containing protein [Candidatus Aminicenantes bacterium]|nr:thioredoxin fold domain-containing protein [Candidatus Aminicenantes bacterium]
MAEIVVCPFCGVKNRIREEMRGAPLCGKCKKPLPSAPPPATGIRSLGAEDFDSAIRLNPRPVLVDFWAAWCPPCRQVAEVLERFARSHPALTVAKVDVDSEPGLAAQYQVFGVPTLVLFVQGREVHRVSGAQAEAELEAEFDPWLEQGPGS